MQSSSMLTTAVLVLCWAFALSPTAATSVVRPDMMRILDRDGRSPANHDTQDPLPLFLWQALLNDTTLITTSSSCATQVPLQVACFHANSLDASSTPPDIIFALNNASLEAFSVPLNGSLIWTLNSESNNTMGLGLSLVAMGASPTSLFVYNPNLSTFTTIDTVTGAIRQSSNAPGTVVHIAIIPDPAGNTDTAAPMLFLVTLLTQIIILDEDLNTRFATGQPIAITTVPVVAPGTSLAYFLAWTGDSSSDHGLDQTLFVLSLQTLSISTTMNQITSISSVAVNGQIAVQFLDGFVGVVELSSGTVVWRAAASVVPLGVVFLAGDTVAVMTAEQTLALFDTSTGSCFANSTLPPVIAGLGAPADMQSTNGRLAMLFSGFPSTIALMDLSTGQLLNVSYVPTLPNPTMIIAGSAGDIVVPNAEGYTMLSGVDLRLLSRALGGQYDGLFAVRRMSLRDVLIEKADGIAVLRLP